MKRVFTIALVWMAGLMCGNVANAQFNETNSLFYHTMRTPQSNLLNAAFFPTNNTWYVTLPGVHVQFGSPLSLSNIMHYDRTTQTTVINIDSVLDHLTDNNKLRFGANVNIFGFGFRVNNTTVNLSTRLVNNISLGLPISTVNALRGGNVDENGNVRSVVELLDGDILNATSYMEAGLGVSHCIKPINLTVGVRAKLLFGVANVQTDKTRLEFNTDPSMDSVTARMYYEIQAAAFAPYDTAGKKFDINIGNIFSQANTGLAFDLGARYDWGPFSFSLAINDLSAGIHWKNNVYTWSPQGGQGVIEFNGLDINTILNNGTFNVDSLTTYLEDRLNEMTPTMKDSGDYWFSIPTKVYLGANYNFARFLRAGFLFHGQFDRGLLSKSNPTYTDDDVTNTFRWNTTLSIGANLSDWIEAIAGNSIVYDGNSMDFFNPGFGLILTPGRFFQLYFMADYISSLYLTDSKAFNMKVGLNFLFGNGGRETIGSGAFSKSNIE